MKRFAALRMALMFGVLSVCAAALQTAPAARPQPAPSKTAGLQTFTGVISDGQCATKGSHAEVMKRASVNTSVNCVKGCARRYWYVLYNPATKKIYRLSDQERAADFAAKKVKVKGSLDSATQVITVRSIEPAS